MGKQQKVCHWESEPPTGSSSRVEEIDHFDARGMRRVYGRGDHFVRLVFNLDVWRSRNGRLFVRFWSRSKGISWCSFELLGTKVPDVTFPSSDHWIPECLREQYDDWVVDCFEDPA